ncbi:hypothetical protein NCR96_08945 [Helicobacter sp. 14348-15]|uniref:hypothetical protein n=1 Tax=Helicobacter TaxID=209 RepID=UPI001F57F080|nr:MULTISPECIES: hypothetical protein [Helicobacter]MCI2236836.1 hypothetical protein [Helicobacter sp. CaF467b]MCL9821859.1 hypothetical protein [Helicobacter colisuis]
MKKEKIGIIKDDRVKELTENYVWLSIEKFCELKGISRTTLWRKIKKDKTLITKKEKNRIYIKIYTKECDSTCFIDDENCLNFIGHH